MVIDFHTHAFPDAIAQKTVDFLKGNSKTTPFTNGTVTDLAEKATAAGVNLSVILPVVTNPLSTHKINLFAASVNENTEKTGVFSFGGIHPETPDYKTAINEIRDLGLKGIKIHPAYHKTQIDDIKYMRIISYAEEQGLITVSHGGLDIGVDGDWCNPKRTAKLIDEVKPTRLVMAHLGGWEQWREVKDYLCGKNVYLDTAFCCVDFSYQDGVLNENKRPVLCAEDFMGLVKAHGTDKILFGTDSPWGEQKTQLNFIRSLPLNDGEKADILGLNAAKLLNLK